MKLFATFTLTLFLELNVLDVPVKRRHWVNNHNTPSLFPRLSQGPTGPPGSSGPPGSVGDPGERVKKMLLWICAGQIWDIICHYTALKKMKEELLHITTLSLNLRDHRSFSPFLRDLLVDLVCLELMESPALLEPQSCCLWVWDFSF